jgi:ABC-type Fe3+-citrate transport system substrate-binding protein
VKPALRRRLRSFAIAIVLASAPALGNARGETLRVASLIPSASAAIEAVAAPGTLVATARRSLHEPVRAGLVDLGNPHSPDLEALAAARPTLIVAERARQERALTPELRERAFWLELATVDATLRSLDALGARVGAGDAMRARTEEARRRIAALRRARPVRVLALFGTADQFQLITERHWLGDLLAQLGAERAGAAGPALPGIVPLTDEVAATLRADLVLVVAHGDPRAVESALRERIAAGGVYAGIASAHGGTHVLDAARFAVNPGLALADAAEELARLLAKAAQ